MTSSSGTPNLKRVETIIYEIVQPMDYAEVRKLIDEAREMAKVYLMMSDAQSKHIAAEMIRYLRKDEPRSLFELHEHTGVFPTMLRVSLTEESWIGMSGNLNVRNQLTSFVNHYE